MGWEEVGGMGEEWVGGVQKTERAHSTLLVLQLLPSTWLCEATQQASQTRQQCLSDMWQILCSPINTKDSHVGTKFY